MKELLVTTSWDDGTVEDLHLGEWLDKYGVSGTLYSHEFKLHCFSNKNIAENWLVLTGDSNAG